MSLSADLGRACVRHPDSRRPLEPLLPEALLEPWIIVHVEHREQQRNAEDDRLVGFLRLARNFDRLRPSAKGLRGIPKIAREGVRTGLKLAKHRVGPIA